MLLQNFKPFVGLGYVLGKMKSTDFPFIGGRVKTDRLTENICKNLQLKLTIKETSSLKKNQLLTVNPTPNPNKSLAISYCVSTNDSMS